MASEFYKDYFERRIPLTGLFLEHLGNRIKEAGEELTQRDMILTVSECLSQTGLVKAPTEADVVEVIEDLVACHDEENKEDGDTGDNSNKGKTFAGYLAEWASSLSYDKLCLYAAGFDYTKAREYFETRDQRSIVAIADEKLRLEFEKARVSFEASLFGFGGGYKGTPKEGDADYDLSSDSESAERALKNLGF